MLLIYLFPVPFHEFFMDLNHLLYGCGASLSDISAAKEHEWNIILKHESIRQAPFWFTKAGCNENNWMATKASLKSSINPVVLNIFNQNMYTFTLLLFQSSYWMISSKWPQKIQVKARQRFESREDYSSNITGITGISTYFAAHKSKRFKNHSSRHLAIEI